MGLQEMIDQMARPPIAMTAQEAGDRCSKMSYGSKDVKEYDKPCYEAFSWTTPQFLKMRKIEFPPDFVPTVCTGEYIGKHQAGPSNCSGQHHMHGKPDVKLICCLCGWEWIPGIKRELTILLYCLNAKLLEDELGF